MNSPPKLEDLIEFEMSAMEKGFNLLKKVPLFDSSPTLTFSIENLDSGSNNYIGNMSANIRHRWLKTEEAEAMAPLFFLVGFKVLDMTIEHLLKIDSYKNRVVFNEKVKNIKSEFKGGKLGFDACSAEWLGKIYKQSVDLRNSAIHKKMERTGALENTEKILQFVEAVYWLVNQESTDPIKRARAIFETTTNAKQNLFTSDVNCVARPRAFEIVKIVGENLELIDPINLRSMVECRLQKIYHNQDFGFHLLDLPQHLE